MNNKYFLLMVILLLAVCWPGPLAAEKPETTIPIFCYHHILPKSDNYLSITPQQFEEQLKFIRDNNYTPISLNRFNLFLEGKTLLPPKPVILTFDDGNYSVYQYGFPLLKKYRFPGVFFVNTERVGVTPEQMNWEQLRELVRYGNEVQSHGHTHDFMYPRPGETHPAFLKRMDKELNYSAQILAQMLSKPVRFLAYPYGWYNKEVIDLAVKYGYRAMLTVNGGPNISSSSPYTLRRWVVYQNDRMSDFIHQLESLNLPLQAIAPSQGETVSAHQVYFKVQIPDLPRKWLRFYFKMRSEISPAKVNYQNLVSESPFKLEKEFNSVLLQVQDAEGNWYAGSWWFYYKK